MAGTIVADQLQDGAGNSTSMDNAIYGSAKAWVNYKGTVTRGINASYNVSSVTVNGTGDYTFNFTNAFADASYSVVTTSTASGSANFQSPLYSQTTTNFSIFTSNGTTLTDSSAISAAVFR